MSHYNPTHGHKLMVVTWLDHFSRGNWHDVEPADLEPLEVVSVGWMVDEDDTMVALSNGMTGGGKAVHTISILKAVIADSYEVVF